MDEELQESNSREKEPPGKKGVKEQQQPGGYMAIYHDIEEIFYGPDSNVSAKERVLFCIRHKLLRDGLCEKHIGSEFLESKTGLTRKQIKSAIKALKKNDLIIIHQNKRKTSRGTIFYEENSYQLNPEKFGELYNWYKNNPTVRLYEGDVGRSYSKQGVVPEVTPGVVSKQGPGVVPEMTPGKERKYSELLREIASNNPLKEPIRKEPFQKEPNSFTQELGKGALDLQKRWLTETNGEISFPEWKKAQ